MSIRTVEELAALRAVGRVVRLTLDALAAAVGPGVTTGELDAVAAGILDRHGASSAPATVYGFPGTVLISVNDEVVHGVPGTRRIQRGDLVKLDVTVQKDGFVADAARSVVAGDGSTLARRLCACAEAAFGRALDVARAGAYVRDIGRAVEAEVTSQGFSVIRGLDGHGIGRTIHEPPSVPNYCDMRQTDILTDGLVLTIEPIISSGSPRIVEQPDGWTIKTRDGSLAAHHEHTLVITHGRPMLLTAA